MSQPSHYEVLAVPPSLIEESKDDQIPTLLKQAYHRALLRHHPDKAPKPNTSLKTLSSSSSTTNSSQSTYTIDQITTAYTTLSSPKLRSDYNISLRNLPTNSTSSTPSAFQTGIETIDLDDLESDDSAATGETTWFKPCRCGNERGFVFVEADLEEAGDLGELIVGCQDCSLWLRVCFAVVEEEEDDDEDNEEDATSRLHGQIGQVQDKLQTRSTGEVLTGEGLESGRASEVGVDKEQQPG
ncbi:Diphthamide biosynthesis protein 4 [Gnomoniopsis sp. IMI 355080]|nr:Diphthamide biosynthesis protein 4 [Gnomoniopsis sp. IMI 355080]